MLLSVGLLVRPNIMIYANEGGRERAVQSLLWAFRTQRPARTRAVPKWFLFKPSRLVFVPYSMPVVDQVLELWLVLWPRATDRWPDLEQGRQSSAVWLVY